MYSIFIGNQLAFTDLTKEEAVNKVKKLNTLLFVGVNSSYTNKDIRIAKNE